MQLTVRDAARFLGVSEDTPYRWVRRGELPAQPVNDQCRFNRVELLESGRRSGDPRLRRDPRGARHAPRGLPRLSEACAPAALHTGSREGQGGHPPGRGGRLPVPPGSTATSSPDAARTRAARLDRPRQRHRHPAPARPDRPHVDRPARWPSASSSRPSTSRPSTGGRSTPLPHRGDGHPGAPPPAGGPGRGAARPCPSGEARRPRPARGDPRRDRAGRGRDGDGARGGVARSDGA